MLRCVIPVIVFSLYATAHADPEAPAEPEAAQEKTAQEAPAEPRSEPQPESKTVSTVEVGTGNFRYRMKLKRIVADEEGVKCSYGGKTGSHKRKTYCRSEAVAAAEEEAAREFFLEAMRNKN